MRNDLVSEVLEIDPWSQHMDIDFVANFSREF